MQRLMETLTLEMVCCMLLGMCCIVMGRYLLTRGRCGLMGIIVFRAHGRIAMAIWSIRKALGIW